MQEKKARFPVQVNATSGAKPKSDKAHVMSSFGPRGLRRANIPLVPTSSSSSESPPSQCRRRTRTLTSSLEIWRLGRKLSERSCVVRGLFSSHRTPAAGTGTCTNVASSVKRLLLGHLSCDRFDKLLSVPLPPPVSRNSSPVIFVDPPIASTSVPQYPSLTLYSFVFEPL